MTKRFLAPALMLTLLVAGCTENPVTPTNDSFALLGPDDDGSGAAKAEKVDLCHVSNNGAGDPSPLSVPAGPPAESHLAHGDFSVGDPIPGMAGYAYDSDCLPNEMPVCTYEDPAGDDHITFVGTDHDGTIETFALSSINTEPPIIEGLHTADVTVTFYESANPDVEGGPRAFAAFIDDDGARTDCSVGLVFF